MATVVTYGAASGWAASWLVANTSMTMAQVATWSSVMGGAMAGAAGGFASGFSGSLLNGGSIGDAFKAGVIGGAIGAASGALTAGIGAKFGAVGNDFGNEFGRALAHGVVGGGISEASGGEFRHGFYAGLAGSAAGSLTPHMGLPGYENGSASAVAARTTVAAVAGGTASALGGGKFVNGAVTAAFQHLLNAEAHRGWWSSTKRFFGGDPEGGFLGTSLTPKEFFGAAGNGAVRGAAAYADGFIPVWDPFESSGVYNHLDDGLYWSQAAGMIGFEAVATVSGTRVLAAVGNTRWGSALNANRFIRFGDGRVGKDMIPRISIGNGKPSWWNHWWWNK